MHFLGDIFLYLMHFPRHTFPMEHSLPAQVSQSSYHKLGPSPHNLKAVSQSSYHKLGPSPHNSRLFHSRHITSLAHHLITSRLDHGSGLLYGLPSTPMTCIQGEHNSAANVFSILLLSRRRSKQKILVYAYKALKRTVPQYFEELVVPYKPTRSLRSESESVTSVPCETAIH